MKKGTYLLLVKDGESYEKDIDKILPLLGSQSCKICYASLRQPYDIISKTLKSKGIDPANFHFVDIMTNSYGTASHRPNCTFLKFPVALPSLCEAIEKVTRNKGCSLIMIDSISSLLLYYYDHEILSFINQLLGKTRQIGCGIVAIKKDGFEFESGKKLSKDLTLFTDKILDLCPSVRD